jgi:hypothetical protein
VGTLKLRSATARDASDNQVPQSSDTHLYPTRERMNGDSPVGVIGEADAEFRVELRLICGFGVREHVGDVT